MVIQCGHFRLNHHATADSAMTDATQQLQHSLFNVVISRRTLEQEQRQENQQDGRSQDGKHRSKCKLQQLGATHLRTAHGPF